MFIKYGYRRINLSVASTWYPKSNSIYICYGSDKQISLKFNLRTDAITASLGIDQALDRGDKFLNIDKFLKEYSQ